MPVVLAGTIFAFACGSSSIREVRDVGQPLRWVGLVTLAVLACAYALVERRASRAVAGSAAFAAALAALALVSASWSVDPRLSERRALTLIALVVTVSALGLAAAGRPRAVSGLLLGILGGSAAVAVASLAMLPFDYDDAWQAATTDYPKRFQGIGQNPNTIPLLLAVGLPLAVWRLKEARSRWVRAALALLLAMTAFEMVASGSRGALLAGFAALLVLVPVLAREGRRRAGLAALVCALFAAGVAIMQIPDPLSAEPPRAHAGRPRGNPQNNAEKFLPLKDEIGASSGPLRRSLLSSSGRRRAWRGAIEQGLERPLLGYGFGTELRVFAERYKGFTSNSVENSYIGLFLQLGLAGLALFLLAVGWVGVSAFRARRRLSGEQRTLATVSGALVVAGLVVALSQSYVYSVGNVATVSVWAGLLLLAASVSLRGEPARRG